MLPLCIHLSSILSGNLRLECIKSFFFFFFAPVVHHASLHLSVCEHTIRSTYTTKWCWIVHKYMNWDAQFRFSHPLAAVRESSVLFRHVQNLVVTLFGTQQHVKLSVHSLKHCILVLPSSMFWAKLFMENDTKPTVVQLHSREIYFRFSCRAGLWCCCRHLVLDLELYGVIL